MSIVIIKLNAVGDVVRTTALLRVLPPEITWVTDAGSLDCLQSLENVRTVAWSDRHNLVGRAYDLVINLEDDLAVAQFAGQLTHARLFGACLDCNQRLTYSEDARPWFDMSLISVHGRRRADELKLANRRTYQELIFEGLGFTFGNHSYVLPKPIPASLVGDVAIAPFAGPVWPMKGWAYYDELKLALEDVGLQVNILPRRDTLLEHLGDIANHRCLVSGDSLPMHFALGTGTPCVTLFNCTSPWEICDYGVQTKLVSQLLEQFFYKRGFDRAATTAIPLEDVFDAVMQKLRQPTVAAG